jgi:4a-hydroxytetrahydrobiopterin dehydratase
LLAGYIRWTIKRFYRTQKLTGDARKAALASLPAERDRGRDAIARDCVPRLQQLSLHGPALVAESDHHPEWFNVYKTVDPATHDAGGEELDIKLAEAMNRLARRARRLALPSRDHHVAASPFQPP